MTETKEIITLTSEQIEKRQKELRENELNELNQKQRRSSAEIVTAYFEGHTPSEETIRFHNQRKKRIEELKQMEK